jgi:hypothetical protein
MHNGKRGAGDIAFKAKTARKPFRELGFTRAQDPVEGNNLPADEIRRPAFSKGLRGLNAV